MQISSDQTPAVVIGYLVKLKQLDLEMSCSVRTTRSKESCFIITGYHLSFYFLNICLWRFVNPRHQSFPKNHSKSILCHAVLITSTRACGLYDITAHLQGVQVL